jgi:hypothetical protein
MEKEIHILRYQKFIESRKNRIIPENVYTEKHHIIPKSLGGNNFPDNLITLTAREHFIAHLILWKAYGEPMTIAFWMMQHRCIKTCKHSCKITSRQYEVLKKDFSEKISETNRSRFCTEETKKKISESHKGEKCYLFGKHLSEETRKKIGEWGKNRHPSEVTLKKMGKAQKGRVHSEESKRKMSESRKDKYRGKNHPGAKKVICIETQEIFGCMRDACNKYKIFNDQLSAVCKGERETIGGYHWQYYDNKYTKEELNA